MSLKNFVIKEIRNMKSFKKSNFKSKINNSLFDTSEHLLCSQNEKIKFLLDEINNKSLIREALLKISKIELCLTEAILVILLIPVKNQIPRTNHSSNLGKLL